MAKRKPRGPKQHAFRNKLLLNQWLESLFGIDPLAEHTLRGRKVRPFHLLADPIKDPRLEGLDHDNLHHFYHALVDSKPFWTNRCALSKEQILVYEENIVRHTQAINKKRNRPIVWKYYQWLSLLFVEIYLDRFFGNRESLLNELNTFVKRFNYQWSDYADVPPYTDDDLNKICMQNATGSGKTLLMHINLLQFRHYAAKHRKEKELSRVILLTPNENLSEQHIAEFQDSGIEAGSYLQSRGSFFGLAQGLNRVDVLEITKLADQQGPNTIATRSLGDQNLLLVDEGHRGMSGKDEGAWFTRRSDLCAKGFTFEYSATFEQAVQASKNSDFENSYAKTVIFDYSYRWFYEDGFGKDYQILNLPESFSEIRAVYMTACLLKFYQQLRIYEEKTKEFEPFNLEKPLWVFVGSTVSSGKLKKDEQRVATDVAQIIQFIADFLDNSQAATRRIQEILTGKGQDTGLLDKEGNDIFAGAFTYLGRAMNGGETAETIYQDILTRLFNHAAGGHLSLERIKGESGEVALRAGTSETPFGLINVGDAKSLCDHVVEVAEQNGTILTVEDSNFTEALFASVRDSASPVNLLIGSKKFVEGWDCWRVSTMGLMHVGRSEGSQIIQLFGRGVRLKGYEWSLKRSGHSHAPVRPTFIEEIETLNVFGIEADFMEKFREFLKEEGLPGNERRKIITIPLNVTYDFGKKLKILRPKRKASNGKEYDFKKDAAVPAVGDIPEYMTHNTVVADWYPRIAAMRSRGTALATRKDKVILRQQHLALLDYDALYFELEQFKRERSWYNFNITKEGIKQLLENPVWYTLYLPETRLNPTTFDGVLLLQQVASELLKRYCDHYYNYRKREYIEPRLELRELTFNDDNIPQEECYQLIVDGDEEQVIQGIQQIKKDLELKKNELLKVGDLNACNFGRHLFQPLFHVRRGGKITILPVALNESEYQFVTDLKTWCDTRKADLEKEGMELFLLRNMSRGKGVGFFEAGNFHPDFILWMLVEGKQYVTFIEPHGLLHEGPGSEKVLFHERVKNIEQRLNDPNVILNSFILSWTRYPQLQWDKTQDELEEMHVLFMTDDQDRYIDKLFARLRGMMA
ncbi:DEAD/DEAH box helicase family protein [Desulfoplanes formicivorans]|uniref:Type III restriction protein res subunit n=1 Tax=Desulfoplanes formicivorans TaxID=1592317 RepID=A0A194AIN5_9BACT|nr:DEAD/DEAH box helicase family protein [Desulfoplanes formicivorans]GAU09095.1 type III restriction protein res subunit [Desulfoplanes formicivorans]